MIALSAWADYVVCYLIYEVHGVGFFYVRIGVFGNPTLLYYTIKFYIYKGKDIR